MFEKILLFEDSKKDTFDESFESISKSLEDVC